MDKSPIYSEFYEKLLDEPNQRVPDTMSGSQSAERDVEPHEVQSGSVNITIPTSPTSNIPTPAGLGSAGTELSDLRSYQ